MNNYFGLVAVILGLSLSTACKEAALTPTTDEDKRAYSVGYTLGNNSRASVDSMTSVGVELDEAMIMQGLKDAMNGTPQIPKEDVPKLFSELQREASTKRFAKRRDAASRSKEEGEAFLASLESQEGIKKTASGLMYQVIEEGDGATPAETDTVQVHYRGTLINGEVFDESYSRGAPATFPLNRVIAGWTEGLQLMKVGAKYKLFIPSNLGYGTRSNRNIPANSTLIFEVELIDILSSS